MDPAVTELFGPALVHAPLGGKSRVEVPLAPQVVRAVFGLGFSPGKADADKVGARAILAKINAVLKERFENVSLFELGKQGQVALSFEVVATPANGERYDFYY